MATKIFPNEMRPQAAVQEPKLSDLREEILLLVYNDEFSEALGRAAHYFFRSSFRYRPFLTKQVLLRVVWNHIEKRWRMRSHAAVSDMIALLREAEAEPSEKPAARAAAEEFAASVIRHMGDVALLIGKGEALVERMCDDEREFTEPAFRKLADEFILEGRR